MMNATREIFSNQAAKCIAINRRAFDKNGFRTLCVSLNEFFKLICNVKNIEIRIPCLSIVVYESSIMIATLHIKSLADSHENIKNFFEKCLVDYELISTSISTETSSSSNEKLVLFMLLNDISQQDLNSSLKIDIYLFTFNKKINLTNIECFLYDNILETKLKQIFIVNTFKINEYSTMNLTQNLENSVCIELENIPLNPIFLMEYLKQWLNDSTQDKNDHLQLVFSSQNCNYQESIIKCSLIERVLNPNQDFKPEYFLSVRPKPLNIKSNKTTSDLIINIHKLKAIKFVKLEGICESVLYGDPFLLKPTANYKLKWNELEENMKNFRFLTFHLQTKGLALLCKLEVGDENQQYSRTTFYIIIANTLSDPYAKSLLVKPILTRSLILNDNLNDDLNSCMEVEQNDFDDASFQKELDSFKNRFIAQLDILDMYNPLQHDDYLNTM